ncbi:MAG: lysophospholipase [Deltaproteobacteria bacterium]|nr:lysophospholipase [Deltaproteobacteria bacterium]
MTSVAPSTAAEIALPGPIDPSETFYFRSKDGQRLYGELFRPESDPRGSVLLLHGYAEHCGRYREVAHLLVARGFAVLGFDFRGHGRSDGQRGFVARFVHYLDDMDAALDELDQRAGRSLRRFLVAHSNGALTALRALADPWRVPDRLEFAVLSSPFLGLKLAVSPVKSLVGRVASLAMPSLTMPNELKVEHLTRDPTKRRERELDTLCHDVASARWFTEAQATQEWVLEFAHRVALPTLWLVGGHDQIAEPESARLVNSRLEAESEYHHLDDFEHEVFNEIERGRPLALLSDYVDRHFPQQD